MEILRYSKRSQNERVEVFFLWNCVNISQTLIIFYILQPNILYKEFYFNVDPTI